MFKKSLVLLFFVVSFVVLFFGWHRWQRDLSPEVAYDDLHIGTQRLEGDELEVSKLRYAEGKSFSPGDNPFLPLVESALSLDSERLAIRRVQPACVAVGQGSGVCVDPRGFVLTNAHVAKVLNHQLL